jgi:hypothetical protein
MTEVNSLSIIENVDIKSVESTTRKIIEFQNIVKKNLKKDKDYGIIPGCNKPTLLKPGAEKILMLMGLQSTYEIIDSTRDWQEGFFQYQVRCTLEKGGIIITQGLGCCNSREKKYVRQDPYSIDNTILKMAKKRSQVDASLTVASLSEIFTQDVEDIDMGNNNQSYSQPNTELATQPQKDKIYGEVVCEKCGKRVYGFKCPICKNADNLHIAKKGFIHSHFLTKDDFKNDMKPVLLPDKLTKIEAMIIWDWWLGSKEVESERAKREAKEKQAKPTKADRIKKAREIVEAPGKVEVRDEDAPFPDEKITDEEFEAIEKAVNEQEENEEPGSSYDNAIPFQGRGKAKN